MRLFILSLLLCFSFSTFGQSDKVVGIWLTQDGDSQVKIYQSADKKFFGQIKWLKNPMEDGKAKLDKKNPSENLKKRPVMDLMLLSGFVYDAKKDQWVDGTIYDPKSGKTYNCYMWFDKTRPDVLHVKGYVGFSWIGRQVEWTRENTLRKQL